MTLARLPQTGHYTVWTGPSYEINFIVLSHDIMVWDINIKRLVGVVVP
jgi:hypothetical protein